jgi:CubicO group peptidase (beta-lactamase class C family)
MKTGRSALLAILILLSSFACQASQSRVSRDQAAQKIDALIQKYSDYGQFNGTALVAREEGPLFKKGYGMANFEWKIPNAPDTRFRLGSITKQFTSMLVMQLVEKGRISLDAKLTDLLPYYRKDTGGKITLHQLLNHTSGIPSYTDLPNFFRDHGRQPLPLRELVVQYCSRDLDFEPGSKFAYNNSGYVILGAVIEQVTGKKYEDVLKAEILEPLGMKATGYDHSEALIEKRASGYSSGTGGVRNADYLDMSLPHAAGSLYSTVEDLYLWDRALYSAKLLSEDGKKKWLTPGLSDYAYGWVVKKKPLGPKKAERLVVEHGGGINGFNTLITRVPEDHLLVVLLNNTGGAPLAAIAEGISDILHEREPQPPKKSIALALQDTLQAKGLDAAIAQYRELKAKKDPGYEMSERELNQLGYGLLGSGRVDDAIAFFKLNIEHFPESANAYDSLGEAYAAKGEKELAIKNYARSIELNPANINGIKKLQELAGK